ncbi:MAG: CRISPR-associated endonuclease Cas2 [Peptostreptococcaceae bacterium]|nr:CRISPR-associated endonuclease Cas2 [Peptostreptococcaceae bacterium]
MEWDVLDQDFEKIYFEDNFTVIVIYDIISNKRRTKLANLLLGFGYRIQKSAFECILTREKCQKLFQAIDDFALPEDLIRIYRLNQNVRSVVYGKEIKNENEIYYFI